MISSPHLALTHFLLHIPFPPNFLHFRFSLTHFYFPISSFKTFLTCLSTFLTLLPHLFKIIGTKTELKAIRMREGRAYKLKGEKLVILVALEDVLVELHLRQLGRRTAFNLFLNNFHYKHGNESNIKPIWLIQWSSKNMWEVWKLEESFKVGKQKRVWRKWAGRKLGGNRNRVRRNE